MIKYGLELEFGSFFDRYKIVKMLERKLPTIPVSEINTVHDYTNFWYLGTDASVISNALDRTKGLNGLELRSPIFTKFPSKELSIILGFLKRNRCFTTSHSGLHFHFSGINLGGGYLFNSTMNVLSRRIRKMRIAKITRKEYCLDRAERYCPIREVDKRENHYECRIFNASLKLRAIYQNWKTLNKMLKQYDVNENESNTLGTNEVGESPTIINPEDFCGIPQRIYILNETRRIYNVRSSITPGQ